MRLVYFSLALAIFAAPLSAQRVSDAQQAFRTRQTSPLPLSPSRAVANDGDGMPSWLKWGIVGGVAGAVLFPLSSSLAADHATHPAQEALAGAVSGFVIVGGAVFVWQKLCGPESASRRSGLCG